MAKLKAGKLWLQCNTQQLTETMVLSINDKQFQFLSPEGANRKVLLPSASGASGLEFTIANTATAYNIVVKDNTESTTYVTLGPGDVAKFVSNSFIWKALKDTTVGLEWVTVSGVVNAVNNFGYLIDASNGDASLILPEIANIGDIISACDAYRNSDTHTITIICNGNNIEGSSDDLLLDILGAGCELLFVGPEYGWKIASDIGLPRIALGPSGSSQDLSTFISSSITDGDVTHAPSGDVVYDALALKVPASRTINGLPLNTDIIISVSGTGLFEIDVDGGLIPGIIIRPDEYFEIDIDGGIIPK